MILGSQIHGVNAKRRPQQLLLSLILFFSAGCTQKEQAAPPPPPKVTVGQPVRENITDYLELNGNTQAINTVQLDRSC